MGQYHSIYNIKKKEYIRIGGAKLWEQAHAATAAALLLLLSNSNGRGGGDFNTYPKNYDKLTGQEKANQIVIDLVSGRWAGDPIVVQGDYATEKDKSYISKFDNFQNITTEVCEALLVSADGDSECDVVKIIESEASNSYGSVKGLSVKKVLSVNRNRKTKPIYKAT